MVGTIVTALTFRVSWSGFWERRARMNEARRTAMRMHYSASKYEEESRNSWFPWNRDEYHEKAKDMRKQAAELEDKARSG